MEKGSIVVTNELVSMVRPREAAIYPETVIDRCSWIRFLGHERRFFRLSSRSKFFSDDKSIVAEHSTTKLELLVLLPCSSEVSRCLSFCLIAELA